MQISKGMSDHTLTIALQIPAYGTTTEFQNQIYLTSKFNGSMELFIDCDV